MKQIQDLISEVLKRTETELTERGKLEPIEMIINNPNQYQYVGEFGIKIRAYGDDNNSTKRFLEFVAISNIPHSIITSSIAYEIGTRDEILSKLNNPNIIDDLQKFVNKCSMNFLMNSD